MVVVVMLAAARVATARPRAKPDVSAMREAIAMHGDPSSHYVSARALAHYMVAVMARANGKESEALAELRLAALYDSDDAYPQCALAEQFLRVGEPKAALETVRLALQTNPNDARSLTLMGRIHLLLGDSDRAAAVLRRAAGVAPHAIEPAALLVEALVAQGDPAAAVAAADRLASIAGPSTSGSGRQIVADAVDHARALARSQARTDASRLTPSGR
jgi:tetratricopeptide (TPR) repeat protein